MQATSSEKKLLSIIIPAYNMQEYLRNCCASLVISEWLQSLEVLIVNDGSKDATSAIGHEFELTYPETFRVIDKPNGNYGSCINRGLSEARGTYIKLLDADDSFDTDAFSKLLEYLSSLEEQSKLVDLVVTDMVSVDSEGRIVERKQINLSSDTRSPISDLESIQLYGITHHCVTYRTSVLADMNYEQIEGLSYTDQEWVRLPLLSVKDLIYLPECVYMYFIGRPGQTMETDTFLRNYWMQLKIKNHMLEFYKASAEKFSAANRNLFRAMLVHDLEGTYITHLFKYKNQLNQTDLIQFDKRLKSDFKEFFAALSKSTLHPLLPVKFIQWWRNDGYGGLRCKCLNVLYGAYRLLKGIGLMFKQASS